MPTPALDAIDLLVFGAHPDDIEFGCGGIVALETRAGRTVHHVVCSRGESGTHGTPEERIAEARRGAEILGATVEFADLGGDAHLEYSNFYALKIAAIIRRFKPSIVLAPTVVESQHPDHAVVGRLVRDAARFARYGGVEELRGATPHAIRALFHYAITPEGEPPNPPCLVVNLGHADVGATWSAAIQAHASQLRTKAYAELQVARARVAGLRSDTEAAIPLWTSEPMVVDCIAEFRTARHF